LKESQSSPKMISKTSLLADPDKKNIKISNHHTNKHQILLELHTLMGQTMKNSYTNHFKFTGHAEMQDNGFIQLSKAVKSIRMLQKFTIQCFWTSNLHGNGFRYLSKELKRAKSLHSITLNFNV